MGHFFVCKQKIGYDRYDFLLREFQWIVGYMCIC